MSTHVTSKVSNETKLQVVPKEYKQKEGSSTFTFGNLYREYSRFHYDGGNILIHLIFVPIIVTCFFGFSSHFPSLNLLKIDLRAN